jgi:8-oxo-dGTP pyrophosphatase MutT (NUDIX family)
MSGLPAVTASGKPDVYAAGGVVRRWDNGSERIAVVRRERHGTDWTLPKGHVENGETFLAAALREVSEETGCRATPVQPLGLNSYDTDEGQKYVVFWLLDAAEEPGLTSTRGEVKEVAWLPVAVACARLTYDGEKVVVDRYAEGGAQPGRRHRIRDRARRCRARWNVRGPRAERLDEAIEIAAQDLSLAQASIQAPAPTWLGACEAALQAAIAARDAGDENRSWAHVHRFQELAVEGFSADEVTMAAHSLKHEVLSGKFGKWRQDAMLEAIEMILEPRDVPLPRQPRHRPAGSSTTRRWARGDDERRTLLRSVMQLRSVAFANEYYKLAIASRYKTILLSVAVAIIATALVASFFVTPPIDSLKDGRWELLGAALSGALGGITSALIRTTRRAGERIPERLGTLDALLSRPVIGAIAGMTAFLAVRAGVAKVSGDTEAPYYLLLAFASGFSERLVVPKSEGV